jgi:uncharacterized membrane protein YbjE (DUF340 family)
MSAPQVTAPATGVAATRLPLGRIAVAGLSAAVGSAVTAILIATVAKAAGVSHAHQLQPVPLAVLTVLGVLVGTAGWVVISRRAASPQVLLRRLVPLVLVVSWVPDLLVGLGGVSGGAAFTLALAHAAVFVVTIPVLARQLEPASLRPVGRHGRA